MPPGDPRLKALTPEQKRRLLQAALAQRQSGSRVASGSPERGLWVKPMARRPHAARRLLCFAHGGAGAASFRAWPDLLPPDIEPLAVHLPGRDSRAAEPFAASLDEAAGALAEALLPWLDRPCLFYGHSLGGALAYATALALRARDGREPEMLIVAAVAPPGRPAASGTQEGTLREQYRHEAAGIDMSHVEDDPAARTHLLERAAADRALLDGWPGRACDPLDAPLLALAGRDDAAISSRTTAGWAACTRGRFDLATLPGPHLFHLGDPAATIERVCRAAGSGPVRSGLGASAGARPEAGMGVSLFFFSADETRSDGDPYRLFDAAVQFADRAGFRAVWIPERHFHPVGGLFPNPSVLAAGVAASTRRLRIRSGSVVLPLHDPIRAAEEWSMVDNLSGGRIDMGVVPGWNPNDYALAPDAFQNRWALVFERLDIVRRLWRGESILRRNGRGEAVQLRLHPKPVQRELNAWIATSANDDSFVRAGELGLNILTALLIQPVDGFAGRVRLYREARRRAGHDPEGGEVTLMVQTFVGETDAEARRVVREPFLSYMRSVQSLWKEVVDGLRVGSAASQEVFEDMIFERYFQKSTLFGSLETCLDRARAFARAGATEIACMVDFGISYEDSLANLGGIDRLRAALAEGGDA